MRAKMAAKGEERKGCLKDVSKNGSPDRKIARLQAEETVADSGADACAQVGVESIPAGAVAQGLFKFGGPQNGVALDLDSDLDVPPDFAEQPLPPNPAKRKEKEEGKSMQELFEAIERVNLNVSALRTDLTENLEKLRVEVANMKAEMVTKEIFESLDARVTSLERQGPESPQISWLKEQVNRLDPCQKCVCVSGLKSQSAASRFATLEHILKEVSPASKITSIENVASGPANERKMTSVSIIEFASRTVRDAVLKDMKDKPQLQKDSDGSTLKFDRAKSAMQLKRNSCLKRALEMIKKDPKSRGLNAEILWKMEGCKDRGVKIGDQIAFQQALDDVAGHFTTDYGHLKL